MSTQMSYNWEHQKGQIYQSVVNGFGQDCRFWVINTWVVNTMYY